MDKKKKIYIAVIIGCFLLSGGILYYSFGSGGSAAPSSTVPEPAAGQSGPAAIQSGYRAPSVFPAETKFDTSVFESSKYKSLRDGKALTVENTEIGRENPFTKY